MPGKKRAVRGRRDDTAAVVDSGRQRGWGQVARQATRRATGQLACMAVGRERRVVASDGVG